MQEEKILLQVEDSETFSVVAGFRANQHLFLTEPTPCMCYAPVGLINSWTRLL